MGPYCGMTDGDGSKPTVLLCEDEYIVALDLQLLLEEFGYEVIGPFDSFSKGLNALNDVRPDMAVLDVRLRDGEVFPLADKLEVMREASPGLIGVPGLEGEIVNEGPGFRLEDFAFTQSQVRQVLDLDQSR